MEDLAIEHGDENLEFWAEQNGVLFISLTGDMELTMENARLLRDRISFFLGDAKIFPGESR
jgi:hypothetical protein